MNNTTSNTTINKEAIVMALNIATIDEIEAYFHVNRNSTGFINAIAELNKVVYGREI